MMKKKYISKSIVGAMMLLALAGITSCEKSLDVTPDPNLGLLPEEAIKSPEDMQKLLSSCYDACANMMNGQFQTLSDLLTDDVTRPNNNEGNMVGVYNRTSSQFNGLVGSAYAQPYFTIYRVNMMDKYYDQISISDAEKSRMQGEGAFLRALCHFETVKLWAQPAGFTPDNSHPGIIERVRAQNEVVLRTSVASNYNLIISDLNKAISLLPEDNSVYANKDAAKALLAKVYFTMGRYTDALPLLNEVIGGGYALSDSLNRFKRNEVESEVIFGFISLGGAYDQNSRGATFKAFYRTDLLPAGGLPAVSMSDELYTLLHADPADKRSAMTAVVGTSKVSTKFNLNDFATLYLHLTDMMLMRAEIHAIQGNTASAIADIAPIVRRAYGSGSAKELAVAGLSGVALLEEIRLQRRLEMHLEGDRLEQAKRIGVSKGHGNYQIRGANWDCPGMVVQFPASAGTVKGFVFNPEGGCN